MTPSLPDPAEVLEGVPDSEVRSRGWTFYLSITLVLFLGGAIMWGILHIQDREKASAAEQAAASIGIIQGQLNDLRTELERCHERATRLEHFIESKMGEDGTTQSERFEVNALR